MKLKSLGFTIVELIVVIVTIAILATIVIVSYSGWQTSVASKAVQSDLAQATAAYQSSINFSTSAGYPSSIPSSFQADANVTVSGGARAGGTSWCITAVSKNYSTIQYYESNKQTTPTAGSCSPTVTTVIPGSSSYNLWGTTKTEGLGWNAIGWGPDGSLYLAGGSSGSNNIVLKVAMPAKTITTFLGNGVPGNNGCTAGTQSTTALDGPQGIVFDGQGNAYIDNINCSTVFRVTPSGSVSVFAQLPEPWPTSMTISSSGTLYIASGDDLGGGCTPTTDNGGHEIYTVSPSGTVSFLAGSGYCKSVDGTGAGASFDYPSGISVDKYGNAYVDDPPTCRIRKITPDGVVTTLVGSSCGSSVDGPAATASFADLNGPMAIDQQGNLYVIDNNTIRVVSPSGTVSTLAGVTIPGYANQTYSMAFDSAGNLWITDLSGNVMEVAIP